ncbi:transcription elongation factor [Candidatus Bathyarchaeota archaeon]|nr:MAG: transcription elongation factor [Candidatus Bathyarchaeota archaeon]
MEACEVGRRKRRRKIVVRKRTLPKVFTCPACGMQSVAVKISTGPSGRVAHVMCGRCGLSATVPVAPVQKEVDAYCKFVDLYYEGKISH